MDRHTIAIDAIKEERVGRRIVFATIDWSFYDGKHPDVKCAFFKTAWERIKTEKRYWENEIMNPEDGERLETMPEDEWCSRYERDLRKIPDAELAAEINRRAQKGFFQTIDFKVEAVVKDKKY